MTRIFKNCQACQGYATKLRVADVKPIREAILADLETHLREVHGTAQRDGDVSG